MVRVDQFLDGRLRVQVVMGMPTVLHPSDPAPGAAAESPVDQVPASTAPAAWHLLLGTESDPHVVLASSKPDEDGSAQPSQPPGLARGHSDRATSKRHQGRLCYSNTWAADGQSQQVWLLDRAKLFVRPNEFLRIAHFFGQGSPEFDPESEDQPNAYQADFERLPGQQMKVEISSSLVCVDSFDLAEGLNAMHRRHDLDRAPHQASEATARLGQAHDDQLGRTAFREDAATSKPGARKQPTAAQDRRGGGPAQEPHFVGLLEDEPKAGPELTTIACRVGHMEYLYAGEQLSQVKEQLAEKLRRFVARRKQESANAGPPSARSPEETKEELVDSSVLPSTGRELAVQKLEPSKAGRAESEGEGPAQVGVEVAR